MTVVFIHGFNVRDGGRKSVDTLIPYFKAVGFDCRELDYGFTFLPRVRLCNRGVAAGLALFRQPITIVAHSNGCAVAAEAADMGAPIRRLVFIAPALDRDWCPPPQVERMDVYWNAGDPWPLIGSLLPWHKWGAMGSRGPSCTDPRIRAFNIGLLGFKGHSAVFSAPEYWGPIIASRLMA